eukprot:363925-Chlamydomonas_euryale.AAC.21
MKTKWKTTLKRLRSHSAAYAHKIGSTSALSHVHVVISRITTWHPKRPVATSLSAEKDGAQVIPARAHVAAQREGE